VQVFDEAKAPAPARTFANPWLLNDDPDLEVPLVFLVAERDGGWVKVNLPERPNGSTGWVRASDVTITQNRFRIVVELAAHQITVYDGESILLQEPVAIGKDATPTPPGVYYLRVLLKAPDPDTVYGPYAYGLSGHSDVLTSFNGGDGEIGIHGNNDASVLGTSVSNGCIRMSNEGITRLTGILPLGTPVLVG
jgi:lipoprotein-anchoring transpeptidase ErfK/SrfK